MARAAISPRECLLFFFFLLIFLIFFSFGVVVLFNVVFQNFPLIINKYLITTF